MLDDRFVAAAVAQLEDASRQRGGDSRGGEDTWFVVVRLHHVTGQVVTSRRRPCHVVDAWLPARERRHGWCPIASSVIILRARSTPDRARDAASAAAADSYIMDPTRRRGLIGLPRPGCHGQDTTALTNIGLWVGAARTRRLVNETATSSVTDRPDHPQGLQTTTVHAGVPPISLAHQLLVIRSAVFEMDRMYAFDRLTNRNVQSTSLQSLTRSRRSSGYTQIGRCRDVNIRCVTPQTHCTLTFPSKISNIDGAMTVKQYCQLCFVTLYRSAIRASLDSHSLMS